MTERITSKAAIAAIVVMLFASTARAADWTIVQGGTYNISGQGLNAGDSIIIDGSTNTNAVTLTVDATTLALGDGAGPAISITAAVAVTVNFTGSFNFLLGNAAATSIAIGTGSLAVTNGGGATGSFVFAANTNAILTIDKPITGTDAVNKFIMGNNTLRTITNTVTLNDVTIGGANAQIDINVATTIDTLSVTSGTNLDFDIATGLTATVTDAVSSVEAAPSRSVTVNSTVRAVVSGLMMLVLA